MIALVTTSLIGLVMGFSVCIDILRDEWREANAAKTAEGSETDRSEEVVGL